MARKMPALHQFVRPPAFAKGYGGRKPMIVRQSSGHFTTLAGKIIVRHYRYFFAISQ